MVSNLTICYRRPSPADLPVELIERKGSGHPDTLSDALGETLSRTYARYTHEHFGAVLHHQFDKVGMMGGRVDVAFGEGRITSPIRVLLNGRASLRFGDVEIPVRDLVLDATYEFFRTRFPQLDLERDLRILYEVNSGASPGFVRGGARDNHVAHFFAPRSLDDLAERKALRCNDTSLGVGYAPPTPLEDLVLRLEQTINGPVYKASKPWLGSDIKLLACRTGTVVELTVAIPQIAAHVHSVDAYREHLRTVREDIMRLCHEWHPQFEVRLHTNTRDNLETLELYLTVTGSAIETGDEGFVGRGNRMGGLIAPARPITMEGISGKNPVYHTGKMYCVAAFELARRAFAECQIETDVQLIGQRGGLLHEPWKTVISTSAATVDEAKLRAVAEAALGEFPAYTRKLLAGEYLLA
jgi:S-adenosylmethionine synthetase